MDAQTTPEFTDYLKFAFLNQYNTIASGGLFVFAMMSGTLGVFLPIWLGVEMVLVMSLSTHPKFQAHVQSEWELLAHKKEERLLLDAPNKYQDRYLQLKECYEDIKKAAASSKTNASISVWQPEIDKLHYVLSSFIKLAHYHNNLGTMLKGFNKSVLETKQKEVQRKMQGASDRLLTQYQKYAEILQQRIEKGEKVAETSEAIRVQLSIIEEQFTLIQQQVFLVKSPHELTDQLDFLVQGINDLENQGNLLMSMQAELDAFVIPPPPED